MLTPKSMLKPLIAEALQDPTTGLMTHTSPMQKFRSALETIVPKRPKSVMPFISLNIFTNPPAEEAEEEEESEGLYFPKQLHEIVRRKRELMMKLGKPGGTWRKEDKQSNGPSVTPKGGK